MTAAASTSVLPVPTKATTPVLSQAIDYPLHIGVTEAGTTLTGAVKSSVGLGILLFQGIGDTMRVSLTGDPVDEVHTIPVESQPVTGTGLKKSSLTL